MKRSLTITLNYSPSEFVTQHVVETNITDHDQMCKDQNAFILTPGAFRQKRICLTFWRLSTWKWSNQFRSTQKGICNMTACFSSHQYHVLRHFCSGVHRNKNFIEKVASVFSLFDLFNIFLPFLFLPLLSFSGTNCASTRLASS